MIAMKNFDTSRSEADMLLDTDSDTDTDSDNQVKGGERPRKNNKRMESSVKKKMPQRQEQTLYDWIKSPASSSVVQSPMRGGGAGAGTVGEERQETNVDDVVVVVSDEDGVIKEEALGTLNSTFFFFFFASIYTPGAKWETFWSRLLETQ